MAFVVLARTASPYARSVVHSHQDSFGHELDLLPGRGAGDAGVALRCACGWSGVLPAADVVLDERVPA